AEDLVRIDQAEGRTGHQPAGQEQGDRGHADAPRHPLQPDAQHHHEADPTHDVAVHRALLVRRTTPRDRTPTAGRGRVSPGGPAGRADVSTITEVRRWRAARSAGTTTTRPSRSWRPGNSTPSTAS